ncbi:MAG: hypothetical protein HY554_19070 [Elusimicrobia bacterium]|nr:hypothetical protein [Elusimicrobiota bacterium]
MRGLSAELLPGLRSCYEILATRSASVPGVVWSALLFVLATGFASAQPGNEEAARLLEWLPAERPRAVALVVHGLNFAPQRMGSIALFLRDRGVTVVRVALEGHRGDPERMKPCHWEARKIG